MRKRTKRKICHYLALFFIAIFTLSCYVTITVYGQTRYQQGAREGIQQFIEELERQGYSCRKAQYTGDTWLTSEYL